MIAIACVKKKEHDSASSSFNFKLP